MPLFEARFNALVIGASGGIGQAFVEMLKENPLCALAVGIGRKSEPKIDFLDEQSIGSSAGDLAAMGPFDLIINAAGMLHGPDVSPEKRLSDLDGESMRMIFQVNAIGPALVMKHFTPLLSKQGALMAMMSAKVGSIGDNRLGGWHSYRASKAALNMVVKTASIELARSNPKAALIAMHPGTVKTGLSGPFGIEAGKQDPREAVRKMMSAMAAVRPDQSGSFLSYDGSELPW